MTQCTPTIGAAELNEWVYRAADDAHLRSIDSPERMSDPSVAETRRAQEVSLGDNAAELVSNGVQQLMSLVPNRWGFLMGAQPAVWFAEKLAERQFEATEQGLALKHAYVRDAMHLAVLNLASGALPRGFVERCAYELRVSRRSAEVILTRLVTSPRYQVNRAAEERQAQRGMEAVRARGIVDEASLAVARRDPSFDIQFRNNPAFRLGVRAELYAAQNPGSR